MKLIATLIFAFLLVGCRTADRDLEPSIFVQNLKGPFISEQFAERLGSLVIEEKYPKDVFSQQGPGMVVDKDQVWLVTFTNALYRSDKYLLPKKLTIEIRKKNGEIIAIS